MHCLLVSLLFSDLLNCFVLKKMFSKNKSIEKLISKVAERQYFIKRSGLKLQQDFSTNKLFLGSLLIVNMYVQRSGF